MISLIIAIIEFFLLIITFIGFGNFFLQKVKKLEKFDKILLSVSLGMIILSYLTFILSVGGFLFIYSFILINLIGILLYIKTFQKTDYEIKGFTKKPSLNLSIIILFLFIDFFYCFFPPTFYDSLMYHLAVPAFYIKHGGMVEWSTNFYSNLPLNGEMIYLFTFLGKTIYLPKLMSFLSFIIIILLLYSWSKKIFRRKNFYLLPALLFMTIPEVGFLSSSTKTDIFEFLFIICAVRVFFYFLETKNKNFIFLSGVFWGAALGTKYIAGFYFFSFCLAYLIFFKQHKVSFKLKSLVIISLLVLIMFSPWLIKNTFFTGNPFYPYLNEFFKSKDWTETQTSNLNNGIKREQKRNINFFLKFPFKIFKPYYLGITAVLGFIFAFFTPLLLFFKHSTREKILIFTALFSFLGLMFFTSVPRYFLPSFLLLSLPIANIIKKMVLNKKILKYLIYFMIYILLLINLFLQIDLNERTYMGFTYLKKRISGDFKGKNIKYLYMVPYYRAAEFINKNLNEKQTILFFGEGRTFYVKKDVIASSFLNKNLLIKILKDSKNFKDFKSKLKNKGIDYILFSPSEFNRFAKMSELYKLKKHKKRKLELFFSKLPVVYSDDKYIIFKIVSNNNKKV